jgi:RecB family exonuclease
VIEWIGPQRPSHQPRLASLESLKANELVDSLPEFNQTRLRTLTECAYRYWMQYVRKEKTFRQDIRSGIGSKVHGALKAFYELPPNARTEPILLRLFAEAWGDAYPNHEERDRLLETAHTALHHAYEMNLDKEPLRMDTEVEVSAGFPMEEPRYKLTSQADRVDWYGEGEYCLVDYKWIGSPITEDQAASQPQTVLYYLTWTANMDGVPPRLISYQFLSAGQQCDVNPSTALFEDSIARISKIIQRAHRVLHVSEPPTATTNNYCFNCTLLGRCPATRDAPWPSAAK